MKGIPGPGGQQSPSSRLFPCSDQAVGTLMLSLTSAREEA